MNAQSDDRIDPFPDVTREELVEFAIHMGIKVKHYWHKYKLIDVLSEEIGKMCATCPLGVLARAADPEGRGCNCPGVMECPHRGNVSEQELGMRKTGKERYVHPVNGKVKP